MGGAEFDNKTREAMFSQALRGGSFSNTARQQQISEEMQRRGWSLNEINALLHGQQISQPNMPNFMGANRAETPQFLQAAGMQFDSEMGAFGAEQAMLNNLMSGAGMFF